MGHLLRDVFDVVSALLFDFSISRAAISAPNGFPESPKPTNQSSEIPRKVAQEKGREGESREAGEIQGQGEETVGGGEEKQGRGEGTLA